MKKFLACLATLLTLLAPPALAAPLTTERLAQPAAEPQNWLMSGGDLAGTRYSALDLINRDNVGRLRLLRTIPYGEISTGNAYERLRMSAPLVEGGAVYFVDGLGRVLKQDLSGAGGDGPLWVADVAVGQMDKWLIAQWSLALYGPYLILATGDGELFWLDAETGAVVRSVGVGDPASGYILVAPPVVVGDRLIVGGAGGERGARPRIDALDAETGASLWSTTPSEGADHVLPGGSFLRSGTYDAASGLMLWSTSGPLPGSANNPSPGFDGTNTVFALDVETGAIAWSHRYESIEGASEEGTLPLLSARESDDETLALHLSDDGRFYRLSAATGELLSASRVVEGPQADTTTPPGCPNVRSERQMPGTLSLDTRLYYAAANNGCRLDLSDLPGIGGDEIGGRYVGKTSMTGALLALDPATGEARATRHFPAPLQSGLLSTAGGLVFAVTADGMASALDDETLAPLWSQRVSSVVSSPPITYAVDGRQYLLLILGGNPLSSQMPYIPGEMRGVRHLTVLAIFGLDE